MEGNQQELPELNLLDLISYLESIQDNYPYGIAERFIAVQSEKIDSKKFPLSKSDFSARIDAAKAIFIRKSTDVSDRTDALLQAAVVKGLKWQWSDIVEFELGKISSRDVLRLLSESKRCVCLVLGKSAWEELNSSKTDTVPFERGSIGADSKVSFLLTHELEDLCDEASRGGKDLKREFWADLQLLKKKVGG